ncbi:DC-STAMP-like protein [Dermatophagoides pteronyssinus]|uniref:DC-STAMP-like protein n=1 Tax=Dermatophagoides pteronyssinus TaxID=6956 RepID=A0ABQ8JE23_DERPT|nr:DC-STAMP-like protein [Dermatophagoides pteronyssinus]
MPWVKTKPKSVNFDVFIIRILEYVEMRIKKELPTIHRILYRCPPDEYILLRNLFNLFGGYFICKLLLVLCVDLPDESDKYDKDRLFIHKWGLLMMITGFVFSIQFRTVICLLLPSLVVTSNGIFFYIRFIQRALKILIPSIFGNIRSLWNIMACLLNYHHTRQRAMFRLAFRPLINLFTDSSKVFTAKELLDSDIVRKNLSDSFQSFRIDTNDLRQYCLTLVEPFNKDDFCSKTLEDLYANSNIFSRQIYNQVYNACYAALNNLGSDLCEQIIDPLKHFDNYTKQFGQINLYDSIEMMQSGQNYEQISETLDMLQSLVGYRMDLEEEFLSEFEWVGIVGFIARVVFLVSLIAAALRAIFYHNNYLKHINFDNHYIDRYFYHIDYKRKAMNKIHLLPLRGNDRWQLIPTFGLKKSVYENAAYFVFQKRALIITFIVFLFLLFIDFVFTDCINTISSKLSVSDHINIMVHRFHGEATGSFFAKVINGLMKKLHFNYTELFRQDWHTCRQFNKNQLGLPQYQSIMIDYILLILMYLLSIHFIRFRHFICDFFYYRYGKQRVIYLYNQKLRNRKRFLRFRRKQVEKMIMANRLFDKPLDSIHKYDIDPKILKKRLISRICYYIKGLFGFNKKQCFICHCFIKKPYYFCSTSYCRLIYCEPCFDDFILTCINCGVIGPPYICL